MPFVRLNSMTRINHLKLIYKNVLSIGIRYVSYLDTYQTKKSKRLIEIVNKIMFDNITV